ncbi:hypothetical protein HAX54_044139 [Datura stramonium]|uniref:Uncharacterized protein n=1 Tax=Datura stramonium TaxID=4076 RepID=A0ABS8W5S1_DATST|nr:hypothetical protein [Datura stramonium]
MVSAVRRDRILLKHSARWITPAPDSSHTPRLPACPNERVLSNRISRGTTSLDKGRSSRSISMKELHNGDRDRPHGAFLAPEDLPPFLSIGPGQGCKLDSDLKHYHGFRVALIHPNVEIASAGAATIALAGDKRSCSEVLVRKRVSSLKMPIRRMCHHARWAEARAVKEVIYWVIVSELERLSAESESDWIEVLELRLFQKRKGMSLKRQVEKGCELKRIEFKPKVFQNRRKAGTVARLKEGTKHSAEIVGKRGRARALANEQAGQTDLKRRST